ncbi:MAG: heavy-metal-associated domain-containing protein [Firmicutes bacterium]|nr:heavy-metal-associated domain-containing protein [Bacillota bacterium]
MKKAEYDVLGMHCVSCSMGISNILKKTKGVSEVNVELGNSKVFITYDENAVDDKLIVNQVARLGYKAVKSKEL